jgi:hypothetical protein
MALRAAREKIRLMSGSAEDPERSDTAVCLSTLVSGEDLRVALALLLSVPRGSPAKANGAEILEMRPSNVE